MKTVDEYLQALEAPRRRRILARAEGLSQAHSDLLYFQGLHDTALDFTMKAFYASAVRERNCGVLGPCQHGQ